MSSIVLELQQSLFQSECDILQALRKAHIIAFKLKLAQFDAWIQSELNGYKNNEEMLPSYRKMKGELKAFNPRGGWIPVVTIGGSGHELSIIPMYESLSALIEIAQQSKDGFFIIVIHQNFLWRFLNKLESLVIGKLLYLLVYTI